MKNPTTIEDSIRGQRATGESAGGVSSADSTSPSNQRDKFSALEMYTWMEYLKYVFNRVYLFTMEPLCEVCIDASGKMTRYPFEPSAWRGGWERRSVALQAFQEKHQLSKLIFLEDELYHLVARYVEVDGEPMCLELTVRTPNLMGTDSFDKNELIQAVTLHNRRMYIDPVTNTYNRRYYADRYQDLVTTCGVAFLDVDNMKYVNDQYGHAMGDLVLHSIAEAVTSCIRPADKLVRYGGDEFLIIFEGIPPEVLKPRLNAVCAKVNAIQFDGAPELRTSVSIGALYGKGKISQLANQADQLLYQAKRNKNCVCTSVCNTGDKA